MKHMWSEEEIQSFKKDISNLVDSKGNPRFVEGNGTPLSQEGVTISYCKWSLSGTHLMLVLSATIANTTVINDSTILATFTLPEWIINKIYPVWDITLESKVITLYASDYTSQQTNCRLVKATNAMKILKSGGSALTLSKDRSFRIQFDLLIDSE